LAFAIGLNRSEPYGFLRLPFAARTTLEQEASVAAECSGLSQEPKAESQKLVYAFATKHQM
jgi:hypothetical protein